MSEAQLKEYKKIFDDFDDKKKGFLSKRDTFDAVRCCGLNPSEDQLKQAVSGKLRTSIRDQRTVRSELFLWTCNRKPPKIEPKFRICF